jgi:hypothetical protein
MALWSQLHDIKISSVLDHIERVDLKTERLDQKVEALLTGNDTTTDLLSCTAMDLASDLRKGRKTVVKPARLMMVDLIQKMIIGGQHGKDSGL